MTAAGPVTASSRALDTASRLRVVLATTTLIEGGVWRHIEDLAVGLIDAGHVVAIALPTAATAPRARARGLGLPVTELRRAIGSRDSVLHVHLHDTFDRQLAAAVAARRVIGPTVITEHLPRSNASDESLLPARRTPFARPAKTLFKRGEFACADAVIAVSPSSADFLAERYGIPRRRLDVVMNGIHGLQATSVDRQDGRTASVVSVGSVIYQKGHDVLVRAAAQSPGGWAATVLGDGPLRESLSRDAASHSLSVTFASWADDVAATLSRSDIACFPSRWESCPYAVIEAMGAGLPVVGTDVDGIRDLVEHGVTGLLVAPDDPHALAAALDALSQDRETRRTMGAAARRVAAGLTVERMCAATLGVYERALR